MDVRLSTQCWTSASINPDYILLISNAILGHLNSLKSVSPQFSDAEVFLTFNQLSLLCNTVMGTPILGKPTKPPPIWTSEPNLQILNLHWDYVTLSIGLDWFSLCWGPPKRYTTKASHHTLETSMTLKVGYDSLQKNFYHPCSCSTSSYLAKQSLNKAVRYFVFWYIPGGSDRPSFIVPYPSIILNRPMKPLTRSFSVSYKLLSSKAPLK